MEIERNIGKKISFSNFLSFDKRFFKYEKDLTKILAIKENLELKLKKKRFYDHSDFETHYKSPYLFNSTQITGDSALPEKLRELAIKIEECDKSNL